MRSPMPAALLLAMTVVLSTPPAFPAPLRNLPLALSQPDGTQVTVFATGDEHHRRVHDAEGFTVVRDPVTGWLVYADRVGTALVPTGLALGIADPRTAGLPPGLDEDLKRVEERARPVRIARQSWPAAPTSGRLTNLMVFVRFEGDDELIERIDDYDREFNSVQPESTSLRAFFREASRGAIDIDTAFVPPPDAEGWATAYTDPHSRSYYSLYHATANPIGYQGDAEAEQREHALLKAALLAVESTIPPEADLDADGDGEADNVIFMVQGFPADPWASLLWPHMWEMFEDVRIQGVRVRGYNLQFTSLMTLATGTFAHEMSHTLGAPDLYHYNQDDLMPVGPWDLMENTASPPQHMLAYLKWKYLGWVTDLPQAMHGDTVRLTPSWDQGAQAVRIAAGGVSSQWFILEYRRAEGAFESSLPGSGLLAYRVDESLAGDGNRNGPPDEVYVFRPGGGPAARGSVGNAPMGAFTGRDRMNEVTNPRPTLQDGSAVTLRVYDVAEDSQGVTFKVCLVAPDCGGKVCGDDGCGGVCGMCAGQTHCVGGACLACSCEGLACGDDGCGTSCGTCDDGDPCTADACEAGACTHAAATAGTACDDGDSCTADDRCDGGGTCVGSPACAPEEAPADLPAAEALDLAAGTDDAAGTSDERGKAHKGGCAAGGAGSDGALPGGLLAMLGCLAVLGRGRRTRTR